MSDLIVLGTDTDAGKTTFALLWLTAFGDRFAYWKPVETGDSDTERVQRLVGATVFEPVARFADPVAPPLAARRAGRTIPPATQIAAARPKSDQSLLIETFGGPLSPLNESELQVELICRLTSPCVLVTSSAVGAVGRSLAVLYTLRAHGVSVRAVVLIGPADEYAVSEILAHGRIAVRTLQPPPEWDAPSLKSAVDEQRGVLAELHSLVSESVARPAPDWLERDLRSVWHPYTALRDPDPPLPVVSAQDEFINLADGRGLIDGISSWWTTLHGHRHPRLMAALRSAARRIDHVHFAGVTHPFAVECAEVLLTSAPWPGGRVFFSDNGSTAVEVALKMAYQYWCHRGEPQRSLFVGFDGGYHGDTFGAMAVGRDPVFFSRFEPFLFQTVRVPVLPDLLDVYLSNWHSKVAAVVIEPLIQAAGGMRLHSPHILRELYEVARRYRILFIVDEVM